MILMNFTVICTNEFDDDIDDTSEFGNDIDDNIDSKKQEKWVENLATSAWQ